MDIICSEKQIVFWGLSSVKTVSFMEQIMSKDKYLSLFSSQMEAFVFIIFQMFFVTCKILKIGQYHSDIPQFQLVHTLYTVTWCNTDQLPVSKIIPWIENSYIYWANFNIFSRFPFCENRNRNIDKRPSGSINGKWLIQYSIHGCFKFVRANEFFEEKYNKSITCPDSVTTS